MTLGYSSVTSNMILPVDGRANESNSHFTNSFGSIVGGVSGCGGAGGSAAALAAKPGYNIMQKGGKRRSKGGVAVNGSEYNVTIMPPQTGGKNGAHRRGGSKRSNKRNKRTKRSNKGGGHAPQAVNLAIDTWPGGSNKRNKRSKRGGLSAMSPASFSGAANAPYHQFTGGQPLSFNYGLGVNAPIPPSDSWMASPPPMNNIHNNCGPNNGLIPLIK